MKIYFENNSAFDENDNNIKEVIKDILENDANMAGNILLEEIAYDEARDYETEDGFVENHYKDCDFYFAYYIVCGNWNQAIGIVAVEY